MNRNTMSALNISAIVLLVLGLQACKTAELTPSQKEERRASERTMARQTLEQLYKAHPGARQGVAKAAGYAVFSDLGIHLVYGGSEKGSGIAINNATKRETFMKMFEIDPGLGLGVAKFRLVLIYESADAFNKFVTSGWEAGSQVIAAAKSKSSGGAYAGAVTVSSGVHMYQLTEEGAMIAMSLRGGKFYLDKELN